MQKSLLMENKNDDDENIIRLYKKGHKPKSESINIDALGALNTCIEDEKEIENSSISLKNKTKLEKDNISELNILSNDKNKQKIEIKVTNKKELKDLEKGRSSGELTPNNQIFSAGRH